MIDFLVFTAAVFVGDMMARFAYDLYDAWAIRHVMRDMRDQANTANADAKPAAFVDESEPDDPRAEMPDEKRRRESQRSFYG